MMVAVSVVVTVSRVVYILELHLITLITFARLVTGILNILDSCCLVPVTCSNSRHVFEVIAVFVAPVVAAVAVIFALLSPQLSPMSNSLHSADRRV